MFTPDQKHILIDGFYDEVEPADAHDEASSGSPRAHARPRRSLAVRTMCAASSTISTASPLLRKYLYQPTLNIDGIVGGHWQEGTKTIIPHEAKAKVDVRMVRHI